MIEDVRSRTRRRSRGWLLDWRYNAWMDAHLDAEQAWRAWKREPYRAELYLAYRAAADREDVAQEALALANGVLDARCA